MKECSINFIGCLFIFIVIIVSSNENLFSQSGILDGSGGGIISFISDRSGYSEIYLMNADGSSVTKISEHNSIIIRQKWSQDGSMLAYLAIEWGKFKLYYKIVVDITHARFSNPILVCPYEVADYSWSSNGEQFIIESEYGNLWGLYWINKDGTNIQSIQSGTKKMVLLK